MRPGGWQWGSSSQMLHTARSRAQGQEMVAAPCLMHHMEERGHGAAQHSKAQHSMARHSTAQQSTAQHSMTDQVRSAPFVILGKTRSQASHMSLRQFLEAWGEMSSSRARARSWSILPRTWDHTRRNVSAGLGGI